MKNENEHGKMSSKKQAITDRKMENKPTDL